MVMNASLCRSFLFAPADSERKTSRALESSADAVILDLEDAVEASAKPKARAMARERLAQPRGRSTVERWVRVNPFDSAEIAHDLDAVIGPGLDGIMLPKAEGAEQAERLGAMIARIEERVGDTPGRTKMFLVAGESPRGVLRCVDYPKGMARLVAMSWGPWDLAAALGASSNRHADGTLKPPYELARSLCLIGAAAAGVAPIETAPMEFRDIDAVRAFAARAASDGFSGIIAIHPDQISAIHEALCPNAEEIAYAQRVRALFASAPETGTVGLDGQMLDRPHRIQAERILSRAGIGPKSDQV
jgi:citrate lyase subunit beta/citryl-CoA lyase